MSFIHPLLSYILGLHPEGAQDSRLRSDFRTTEDILNRDILEGAGLTIILLVESPSMDDLPKVPFFPTPEHDELFFRIRDTMFAGMNNLPENIPFEDSPERSPLDKEALNLDELKLGMEIQRMNIQHGPLEAGIVIGEPFESEPLIGSQPDQMVPVRTTDYCGETVHEDWFLSDMGVVPYKHENGSLHWNGANYTLAVKS